MSCEMGAPAIEETLGPLLNVLAQSPDVQEVFARLSALARQTVPHDCLLFGLVTEDGERYRVVAVSEDDQRAALLETSFAPFFFSSRRRHTRSDRDWSSDVCSSD